MQLNINGRWIELSNISPSTPLLYVLRNDLKLNGPKYGCGLGECGACSVLIDGKVVRSCSTPVST
ncbi:2Fe-2S iron-sulfur cluster-binding protein, partial [Escherichia coli]|nr:2Fe-2S iron-sulfur cluster-binding protein [Escherichia coli]